MHHGPYYSRTMTVNVAAYQTGDVNGLTVVALMPDVCPGDTPHHVTAGALLHSSIPTETITAVPGFPPIDGVDPGQSHLRAYSVEVSAEVLDHNHQPVGGHRWDLDGTEAGDRADIAEVWQQIYALEATLVQGEDMRETQRQIEALHEQLPALYAVLLWTVVGRRYLADTGLELEHHLLAAGRDEAAQAVHAIGT